MKNMDEILQRGRDTSDLAVRSAQVRIADEKAMKDEIASWRRLCAAMVDAAGGRIDIPRAAIESIDPLSLTLDVTVDVATKGITVRLQRS